MEPVRREDVAKLRELVRLEQTGPLEEFLRELHPADIADLLEELEGDEQIALIKLLDTERAAEVLTEIDEHSGQTLLLLLTDREIATLVEEMYSDDAADMLATLPPEKTERIEALIPSDDREELRGLMEFDEESAGGIMEVERISVVDTATIGDAIEAVRDHAEEIENLQKIYVVNGRGELVGELGVLDLIVHPQDARVRDLMETNIISVPVDMDQEEVAGLFGKYDEFTLPVVDEGAKLVGRITVDDIIDVIEEEASEDIAHIAGTTEEELGEPSVFKVSRRRLPWLVTGLGGQLVAALLLSQYEVSLQTYVVLAFFVPLIIGTAGSVGIQAAVVVVREIALGQVDLLKTGRRVAKEMGVACLNGVVLGALLFAAVVAWRREIELGVLLWASLMSVVLVAAFIGASVPLLLERWKVDPAIATGPFITVTNDIIGLAIYLSLAGVYLSRL